MRKFYGSKLDLYWLLCPALLGHVCPALKPQRICNCRLAIGSSLWGRPLFENWNWNAVIESQRRARRPWSANRVIGLSWLGKWGPSMQICWAMTRANEDGTSGVNLSKSLLDYWSVVERLKLWPFPCRHGRQLVPSDGVHSHRVATYRPSRKLAQLSAGQHWRQVPTSSKWITVSGRVNGQVVVQQQQQ